MKTEPDEEPPKPFDGAAIQGFLGSLLRNNGGTTDQNTHNAGPSLTATSQPAGRPKRMTKKSRKQRPRVRLFKKYFK